MSGRDNDWINGWTDQRMEGIRIRGWLGGREGQFDDGRMDEEIN